MRLRQIEAALERVLDGAFARALPGQVQPIEVFQALWRGVEDGKVLSAEAVYAPNRLTARLSPDDLASLAGIQDRLVAEFEGALEEEARRREWSFGARIIVRLADDDRLRRGRVEVAMRLDEDPIPAHLAVEAGVSVGQVFELRPGVTLGRSAECDIVVPDEAVSRRHCRFDWTFDGYRVVDLGSSNGTCANEVRITEHVLSDADILSVGESRLRFEYETHKVPCR